MISKRRTGAYLGAAVALYAMGAALVERKRLWTLSHSNKGFGLVLTEAPAWAFLVEDALLALPCTCNAPQPDWVWKVGLRRFGVHDDNSGDPIHSLGSALHYLCSLRQSVVWRVERTVAHMPLTEEEAQGMEREWVARCNAIYGEE